MAALESKILIQSGKTVQNLNINLSEQEVVSFPRQCLCASACMHCHAPNTDPPCVQLDCLNTNCQGGYTWDAFNFVAKYGVVTEQRYPYTSVRTP